MYTNQKPITLFDHTNETFRLAADFVNYTNQHVFLTGKAGTGKTTFLRYIKEITHKETVVAAPTGVAAINAEGVTLHSLFQLPFEPFIPTFEGRRAYLAGKDNRFRFNKTKIELIRKIELLIIDEVSMLRADTLDAIDYLLKHFRQSHQPFGGVQMLYIGDLFQLPPVVKDTEWEILKNYYESPFFFHAKAIESNAPIYVELKKIYRQNEQTFINLLNAIRNNNIHEQHLALLKSRYIPNFEPSKEDNYIVLSTHNYKADNINQRELDKLPGKIHSFAGSITGDFPDHILPTEKSLQLKEGSQIMFIKNDLREPRRYYNGKIATIVSIKNDKITVSLADSEIQLELEKEVWRNIRYTQNTQKGIIEEEELGSFTQYPVRLAWAITIHKSQGLTFEKAIIDAEKAFAPGQVYVALSRCTTLEGIVLSSPIATSITTDPYVLGFANLEAPIGELQDVLEQQKRTYCINRLLETFNFDKLQQGINAWKASLPNVDQLSCFNAYQELLAQMLETATVLNETGQKFQTQLYKLILSWENTQQLEPLKDRVQKATKYFYTLIEDRILAPLQQHQVHFKKEKKLKEYLKTLEKLRKDIQYCLQKLNKVFYGEIVLSEYMNDEEEQPIKAKLPSEKKTKGDSALQTLQMFKEGLPLEKIAEERGLALTTISGHLCAFITEGKIVINEIIQDTKRIDIIIDTIKKQTESGLKPLKEALGDDFSYNEIQAVVNHMQWMKKQEEKL